MERHLFVFGCNEYLDPNANLRGCGNDCNTVMALCQQVFGGEWKVHNFFGTRNVAKDVKAALLALAKTLKPGDVIWIHNSSHGTTIPIGSVKHHATVPYNFDWNDLKTFMLDTDYWEIFAAFVEGVHVTFTSDSCFSQGLTSMRSLFNMHGHEIKDRFLPCPLPLTDCKEAHPRGVLGNELDIAAGFGCLKDQTSADVTDNNGVSYGAYTHHLANRIREDAKRTFALTHELTNKDLAENQFEQRTAVDGGQINNPWHGGLTGEPAVTATSGKATL
jgi:hypothetical protein